MATAANKTSAVKTWWSERWLAILGQLVDAPRLSQGRWHARNGRVVRLDVTRGTVVARLEGGLAAPRTVSVRLTSLPDAAWDRVLRGMAAEARYSAYLLTGELPEGIEALFEAAGADLFPRRKGEITLTCTCSEARRGLGPCKHAAAVCVVLGERFDTDPWLIFELRGRTREQMAASLRARRTIGALESTFSPAAHDLETAAPAAAASFWSYPGDTAALEAVAASLAAPDPLPTGPAAPEAPADNARDG